ncbi:MAG: isoprenylcysteine carboxylmethyltransferase family protein [Flavobacteriales bacterium]
MLLVSSLERQGRILFKYRGYFPVLLFLLVVPFLWMRPEIPQGPIKVLLFALSVLMAISGILVRAYTIGHTPKGTSGRNTAGQKAETLNTTGIYSLVRHPLYLGNFLIWAGIGMFTYDPVYFLILLLIFWLFYERIMYAEERFLEGKFGEYLSEWAEKVPAFFPRFRGFAPAEKGFSIKKVLRKEYSGFLATVIGFVYVAFLRDLFQNGGFEWDPLLGLILLVAFLITFSLRSLHHWTTLLKER